MPLEGSGEVLGVYRRYFHLLLFKFTTMPPPDLWHDSDVIRRKAGKTASMHLGVGIF